MKRKIAMIGLCGLMGLNISVTRVLAYNQQHNSNLSGGFLILMIPLMILIIYQSLKDESR